MEKEEEKVQEQPKKSKMEELDEEAIDTNIFVYATTDRDSKT